MRSFEAEELRATGMISVSTIAKPPKMAPATKYGGKIVVCQPGSCDVAKSKDTTECTAEHQRRGERREQQVGAARSGASAALPSPRQPSASMP